MKLGNSSTVTAEWLCCNLELARRHRGSSSLVSHETRGDPASGVIPSLGPLVGVCRPLWRSAPAPHCALPPTLALPLPASPRAGSPAWMRPAGGGGGRPPPCPPPALLVSLLLLTLLHRPRTGGGAGWTPLPARGRRAPQGPCHLRVRHPSTSPPCFYPSKGNHALKASTPLPLPSTFPRPAPPVPSPPPSTVATPWAWHGRVAGTTRSAKAACKGEEEAGGGGTPGAWRCGGGVLTGQAPPPAGGRSGGLVGHVPSRPYFSGVAHGGVQVPLPLLSVCGPSRSDAEHGGVSRLTVTCVEHSLCAGCALPPLPSPLPTNRLPLPSPSV